MKRIAAPFLVALGFTTLGAPAVHADPAARLTVSTVVDKIVAKRGETLTYHVRVENIGDAPAAEVRVHSHIPRQTTEQSDTCPEGTFEPDGDICLQPGFPTPGLGEDAHQIDFLHGPTLAPGEGFTLRFAVRIDDDGVVGSHLRNHAHASHLLGSEITSAPVDTLTVDAVANAIFSGNLMTISGGGSIDSYDSSVGPYALTHANSGGDIASNGNISVSGGSVVYGDATPGPGGTVTVSNNSIVTGSTAPAPSVVMMNSVDSAPYAGANDNARICLAPGSCTGAVYADATKTLTVAGTAVLGPGAYFLCRLEVTGILRIAGVVSIWMGSPSVCGGTSSVRFAAGGSVDIASGRPRDFQLLADGGATLTITSHATFSGVLYAPAAGLTLEGGSHLYGGASLGTLAAGAGGSFIHFDRSLSQ